MFLLINHNKLNISNMAHKTCFKDTALDTQNVLYVLNAKYMKNHILTSDYFDSNLNLYVGI